VEQARAFSVWVLLAAAPVFPLEPNPGDVYREFYAVMSAGKEWRVTDPQPEHKGAFEFLPNSVLRLHVSTLAGAIRAELLIDRWGGHPGTTGQQIRLNASAWIDVPQRKTAPAAGSPLCYMSQDNPVLEVPLSHLKEGENTLEGTAGDQAVCTGAFGWGQWGWYGAVLRVYYHSSAAPHTMGRIVSPARGASLPENPEIRIETRGQADRVDVLARYDGYDENGDGIFADWHGAYHYIDLQHHTGSSARAPHVVRWNTTWVPDQPPGAVKLIARIRSREGVWYVAPVVEGLSLKRSGTSVKLYHPVGVPERFWVRAGKRLSSSVEVADDAGATEAAVALRTWNGHGERFSFNGHPVEIAGADHNYALGLRPVPVSAIRRGRNAIEFHSTTEHHGVEILWPGPALLVRYGRSAPRMPEGDWLSPDYDGRFSLDITAGVRLGPDKPVEIALPASVTERSFRVVEYQNGTAPVIRDGAVPWQLDPGGRLVFLLSGLGAGQKKRLAVYFGKSQGLVTTRRISVEDEVMHEGQASLRVRTAGETYVYHKEGAGFASIFDRAGNDWISFRPGNRSAGEFRGIPNLGECFHPGNSGSEGALTTLESSGPLRARFRSETVDGRYAATWDIYPTYAQMTLHRAGGPYWFLYEGTPGGKLDVPEDFWVTSAGIRRSVADSWSGDLEQPEWVYFADGKLSRALFVASHQDDTANDQFWQMESNMTVWGFGREYRCCTRYLTALPAQFTIGLLETADHARASAEITAAMAVPKVVVGQVELRTPK
jgi:hypothetical protein